MHYEINDLLFVETDVDVPIPEYYAVDSPVDNPDIALRIVDTDELNPPSSTRRIGSRYSWEETTETLYLNWNLPLDLRAKMSGLANPDTQTTVELTEQYRERGKIKPLFESVMHAELIARDHAIVHSGSLWRSDGGILVTGWDDMGKTSTCLSVHHRNGFSFIGDDGAILGADGTVHAWDSRVGISPYTATGNIEISIKKRLRILVKRFSRLVPGLSVLHKTREHIDVTDIIEHTTCSPSTVFFLEGGSSGTGEIETEEAVRRLIETSNADKRLLKHDMVRTYAYLCPRASRLQVKRRDIIDSALSGIETVELCSEDKDVYPDWIVETYPEP